MSSQWKLEACSLLHIHTDWKLLTFFWIIFNNSVLTLENTYFIFIAKFMLGYSENHTKPINTLLKLRKFYWGVTTALQRTNYEVCPTHPFRVHVQLFPEKQENSTKWPLHLKQKLVYFRYSENYLRIQVKYIVTEYGHLLGNGWVNTG
jgi:hypothetical protein